MLIWTLWKSERESKLTFFGCCLDRYILIFFSIWGRSNILSIFHFDSLKARTFIIRLNTESLRVISFDYLNLTIQIHSMENNNLYYSLTYPNCMNIQNKVSFYVKTGRLQNHVRMTSRSFYCRLEVFLVTNLTFYIGTYNYNSKKYVLINLLTKSPVSQAPG